MGAYVSTVLYRWNMLKMVGKKCLDGWGEIPPNSLMYIAQILPKKQCLFIHANLSHHQ